MNRFLLPGFFTISFSLFILAACGGCGNKGHEVIRVQGRITYKGQPLKYGFIAFHAIKTVESGAPHRIARSIIDHDGNYSLSTFKKDDGVMPGDYKVVVIYAEKRKSTDLDEYVPPSIIPEKYSKAETTPLRATLSPGSGLVTLDFKLD